MWVSVILSTLHELHVFHSPELLFEVIHQCQLIEREKIKTAK